MSKIITIFGATGNQGGSVVNAILEHPKLSNEFKIRAITRDPSKPSGRELVKRGCEVVKADMMNKDSLREALRGSHSVFIVTNFWEDCQKAVEIAMGKNTADVCKELAVQHVIHSTTPSPDKGSGGKILHADHFEAKAIATEYMKGLGLPLTTFVAGFYMSNFKNMIKKGPDGTYAFSLPIPSTVKLPLFEANQDTGKFIVPMLENPNQWIGESMAGASGWWNGEEIVKLFKEVYGVNVIFREISDQEWRNYHPPPVQDDMSDMMLWIKDYAYFGEGAKEFLAKSLEQVEQAPTSLRQYFELEPLAK